jgi:hypothetical protein
MNMAEMENKELSYDHDASIHTVQSVYYTKYDTPSKPLNVGKNGRQSSQFKRSVIAL